MENNILTLKSVDCNSRCEACLKTKEVCNGCSLISHQHISPCLRACFFCINENKRYIRRVVLVLTADCKQGNKTSFRNITSSIKNNTIDPDLALLTILPDAVYVGKSLIALFCNWQPINGNESANLAITRTLRNRSSNAVMEKMREFIPKSDHVRKRDRQDLLSVTALTKPECTRYLSSLGNISSTLIPEQTKHTEDNRVSFYPKPIDVCIGKFGTLLILFDFCEKEQTTSLLSAWTSLITSRLSKRH